MGLIRRTLLVILKVKILCSGMRRLQVLACITRGIPGRHHTPLRLPERVHPQK